MLRGGAEHIVQFPAEVATLELVTQGQVVDKIRILVFDGVVGVNSLELSKEDKDNIFYKNALSVELAFYFRDLISNINLCL